VGKTQLMVELIFIGFFLGFLGLSKENE